MNILAIDDNEKILALIEAQIAKLGLKIDTANSAKQGIQFTKEKAYDLILVDLNMPEMNGVEVSKKIRKSEKKRSLIYAFSAYEEQLNEADMNIFDGVYNKPHDAKVLLADIKKIEMSLK